MKIVDVSTRDDRVELKGKMLKMRTSMTLACSQQTALLITGTVSNLNDIGGIATLRPMVRVFDNEGFVGGSELIISNGRMRMFYSPLPVYFEWYFT